MDLDISNLTHGFGLCRNRPVEPQEEKPFVQWDSAKFGEIPVGPD